MTKIKYLFFTLVLMGSLQTGTYGQANPHELVIQDFNASGHYLNNDILGDSTTTGARKDPDRVYVLQRGGIYFINTSIRNDNWMLRIKAADGVGRKPAIYAYKNTTTAAYPAQLVEVRGNLSLKNLALIGWSEFFPTEISLNISILVYVTGIGTSIDVDSCVLSAAKGAHILVQSGTHRLRVTNTIFAQLGNLFATNMGNGRPIDMRTTSIDTLFVQNCTMLDGTDRTIRHYSSTAGIDVLVFDHNTVANQMSMHGCLALGWVGKKITITNNVFVDNFALGNDSTDAVRLAEMGDSNERGRSGAFRMAFVSSTPNDTTQWVVRNNFYSVTPELQAWYNTHSSSGIGNLIPLTWHISKRIGADSVNAFKKETITFTKPTKNLVPMCTYYWDPNGGNKSKVQTNFSSAVDFYRPQWPYYLDTLDLSYQTAAQAYTGASAGYPAGDLNWFPSKKAGWLLTDVEGTTASVPAAFELCQNYPNPFNPSTTLQYSVSKFGRVVLEVFNILGQSVALLVDEELAPGIYKTTFDASTLSSGVYLYQLKAGDFIQTQKMIFIK
ncbi:MAG: T9SS type A sorting domain-containing protein [Ignavibacteria bacterium]|nr:T9SS type A sorting domain-containing protein [Ignavibacteria bacterium]